MSININNIYGYSDSLDLLSDEFNKFKDRLYIKSRCRYFGAGFINMLYSGTITIIYLYDYMSNNFVPCNDMPDWFYRNDGYYYTKMNYNQFVDYKKFSTFIKIRDLMGR